MRTQKTYYVSCYSLTVWRKAENEVEVWASFNKPAVFQDGDEKFTWPKVDLLPGDNLIMTAEANPQPEVPGRDWFTVPTALGGYLTAAPDTPGLAEHQIEQTIICKFGGVQIPS